MTQKFSLAVLAVLGLLLPLSCNKQGGEPEASPIVFTAFVESPSMEATKADGSVSSQSDLVKAGFGVFACYTRDHRYSESSVMPDFMYNEHLYWDSTHAVWDYQPLKYWPGGEGEADSVTGNIPHYISFFAYSPYSDGDSSTPSVKPAGYCIPSFIRSYEQDNPWILYRLHPDVSKQVDLLYAVPLLDQTKSENVSTRLPFQFRHALGCIGDNVGVTVGSTLAASLKEMVDSGTPTWVEYYLTGLSIRYTLTEKGRLTLWSQGTPNWSAVVSEDFVTTRDVQVASGQSLLYRYDGAAEDATPFHAEGKGVFYIPLQAGGQAQKAEITLSLLTKDSTGAESAVTKTTTYTLTPERYAEGKDIALNIVLSNI